MRPEWSDELLAKRVQLKAVVGGVESQIGAMEDKTLAMREWAVKQIRVDREKINYVDLCHYGCNIWYALKCACNRFYDQKELVVWLKKCFEPLNRYDERTLRAKLRATDGVSGCARNIWIIWRS